ncbi:MAG: DUF427 domain-containing protein [Candidatus Korobacteraceae bacterium]
MKEKQVKLPGPDHPISIERNPARVVVSVAGRVVADTRNALTLREAGYPPVQYIPGADVDFPNWNGRITLPTALIKAIAVTTAFPLEEKAPSMRCGYMRIPFLLLRKLGGTLRSIPSG